MWWISLLLPFFHVTCKETPVSWGSSVVTATQGKSPLLRYESKSKPSLSLDGNKVNIINETCYVNEIEVGRPCSFTEISFGFATKIQISSVNDHKALIVGEYSTYFAPDCVFPKQSEAYPLPEASLPLSRFMKGFNEVNITFAASINFDGFHLILKESSNIICEWSNQGLFQGDEQFCRLIFRNNNSEAWFYGVFNKENNERNNYEWWNENDQLTSVSVDWMQTGNAPEDEICARNAPKDNICLNHAPYNSGTSALMLLLLLRQFCKD